MFELTPCDAPELMDSAALAPEELGRALDFLGWSNRRFGGHEVVLERLRAWTAARPRVGGLSLLDVGTGGADLPLALAAWARRRDLRLSITAVDAHPLTAELARERARGTPEIEVLHADLDSMARSGRRFDFVTASLLLHHVPRPGRAAALRALAGLALRGLVVSDLRRSAPAWAAVAALSRLGGRLSRADGPRSVRRAFTPRELEALAQEAGLPFLEARAHPYFRLSLSGRTDGA